MIDDPFTHFVAFLGGVLIGFMLAATVSHNTWSKPETHHHDAYDANGNLTCEFCKALVEKGRNKDGK